MNKDPASDPAKRQQVRAKRLAAALRDNLKRRKEQARGQTATKPDSGRAVETGSNLDKTAPRK